ncbi:unnamed protein product [Amoebophrya sp. A25]|nr:unnamed protein product [Amoebophrya sp. A25]|eukprot:GSA25T00022888001.1
MAKLEEELARQVLEGMDENISTDEDESRVKATTQKQGGGGATIKKRAVAVGGVRKKGCFVKQLIPPILKKLPSASQRQQLQQHVKTSTTNTSRVVFPSAAFSSISNTNISTSSVLDVETSCTNTGGTTTVLDVDTSTNTGGTTRITTTTSPNHGEQGLQDDDVEDLTSFFRGKRILVVGDGDLSFSASLVCYVEDPVWCLTASVIEDEAAFLEKYDKQGVAQLHQSVIRASGARLLHGVDATKLEEVFGQADNTNLREDFDVIIFNFPYPLSLSESDARGGVQKEAQQLVKMFLSSAEKLLSGARGEIHLSLVNQQFRSWCVTQLANECSLYLSEVRGFDKTRWKYYNCRFGDEREKRSGKASYVGDWNARTFVFRRRLPDVPVDEINPETNQILGSVDDKRALELIRSQRERERERAAKVALRELQHRVLVNELLAKRHQALALQQSTLTQRISQRVKTVQKSSVSMKPIRVPRVVVASSSPGRTVLPVPGRISSTSTSRVRTVLPVPGRGISSISTSAGVPAASSRGTTAISTGVNREKPRSSLGLFSGGAPSGTGGLSSAVPMVRQEGATAAGALCVAARSSPANGLQKPTTRAASVNTGGSSTNAGPPPAVSISTTTTASDRSTGPLSSTSTGARDHMLRNPFIGGPPAVVEKNAKKGSARQLVPLKRLLPQEGQHVGVVALNSTAMGTGVSANNMGGSTSGAAPAANGTSTRSTSTSPPAPGRAPLGTMAGSCLPKARGQQVISASAGSSASGVGDGKTGTTSSSIVDHTTSSDVPVKQMKSAPPAAVSKSGAAPLAKHGMRVMTTARPDASPVAAGGSGLIKNGFTAAPSQKVMPHCPLRPLFPTRSASIVPSHAVRPGVIQKVAPARLQNVVSSKSSSVVAGVPKAGPLKSSSVVAGVPKAGLLQHTSNAQARVLVPVSSLMSRASVLARPQGSPSGTTSGASSSSLFAAAPVRGVGVSGGVVQTQTTSKASAKASLAGVHLIPPMRCFQPQQIHGPQSVAPQRTQQARNTNSIIKGLKASATTLCICSKSLEVLALVLLVLLVRLRRSSSLNRQRDRHRHLFVFNLISQTYSNSNLPVIMAPPRSSLPRTSRSMARGRGPAPRSSPPRAVPVRKGFEKSTHHPYPKAMGGAAPQGQGRSHIGAAQPFRR